MIAANDRPMVPVPDAEERVPEAQDARDLALGYLRYASACWRGDAVTAPFATALSAFWRGDMPPAPESRPVAVSPHGGGGRGIRWHQRNGQILGYVPGASGGYAVPVAAVPRLLRCVPAAQCVIHRRGEACPRPSRERQKLPSAMGMLRAPMANAAEPRTLAVV
jgi:hypothetical protein